MQRGCRRDAQKRSGEVGRGPTLVKRANSEGSISGTENQMTGSNVRARMGSRHKRVSSVKGGDAADMSPITFL